MVGSPADLEEVTMGERGVLAGLAPGGLLIDLTTSTPSLAQSIAAWAAVQVSSYILGRAWLGKLEPFGAAGWGERLPLSRLNERREEGVYRAPPSIGTPL